MMSCVSASLGRFQSTLPTRGSDAIAPQRTAPNHAFQSTLPTRGSDGQGAAMPPQRRISIHAPHEGERRKDSVSWKVDSYFNPRSPRGGATCTAAYTIAANLISIHAPHEGERLMLFCIANKN